MKKLIVASALAAAFAAPAFAQTAAPVAAEAAPAGPHTLTANIGLFSSYRFRGIDQTFGKPALQGGFDYSHESGFYAGNWNSNVQEGAGYPDASLEMDFYGGWKKTWGDWGLDVGGIYYYYPGSDSGAGKTGAVTNYRTNRVHNGSVNNKEVYVGGSWKFLSAKYYYGLDDYFSTPGSDHSSYLDLSANYDLGDGWGVNAHVGRLNFKGQRDGDYTDWKLGVTKDINGWVVGASYVDTNAHGSCSKAETYCFTNSSGSKDKDAGRGIAVVSVSRTF